MNVTRVEREKYIQKVDTYAYRLLLAEENRTG